ncbi:MAG: hypothetical protein ACRELW_09820 [Candidatus Rokuibacteriota bacterium]
MTLRFGVFDHIEPVPGLGLDRIYRERLLQIERLDAAGFSAGLPTRELRRDIDAEIERFDQQAHRPHPNRLGGVALAGSPAAVREYMDEYLETGANYFVCSFQWGDITHEQAIRSIELFTQDVMPRYAMAAPAARG